ncbi:hypothetical protein Tco_0737724, partial [Tanacetum coccineum]
MVEWRCRRWRCHEPEVYEPEVKGTSSSNTSTQNMAFVSSNNSGSTNEVVNTTHGVSAVSTQASAANSTNVDNLSDAMWLYALLAGMWIQFSWVLLDWAVHCNINLVLLPTYVNAAKGSYYCSLKDNVEKEDLLRFKAVTNACFSTLLIDDIIRVRRRFLRLKRLRILKDREHGAWKYCLAVDVYLLCGLGLDIKRTHNSGVSSTFHSISIKDIPKT